MVGRPETRACALLVLGILLALPAASLAGVLPTPTATPTAGPGGDLNSVLRMDFDGVGCVDSVTGDTCSASGADADYATGAAPLDGNTYSLQIGRFGSASSTTVDYMDAATLDFLMNINVFGTNSGYYETIGVADGSNYKCGLVIKSNVGRFHIGRFGNEGAE